MCAGFLGSLPSCGSGDDGAGGGGEILGETITAYVAFQRSNGIASIARSNGSFQFDFQIFAQGEGGMALDYLGNLYQADLRGDDGGAILVMGRAQGRSFENAGGSFLLTTDREIFGGATTLDEPRSVALAHRAGAIIVTDTGDSSIKVFGSAAGGDVPPIFTAVSASAPWDIAYDEASDTLYATLSDGSIAFFTDFLATEPFLASGTILPSLDGISASGTDLRGIAIQRNGAATRCVVSDLGAENGGTDGRVYVFDDITGANGLLVPDQVLRGATAGLRDPVDLAVSPDGVLRVIDAGSGRALGFASAGPGRFGAAPRVSASFEGAAAIVLEPRNPVVEVDPVSDIDMPSVPISELLVTVSPAGMNSELLRLPADLVTPGASSFDAGATLGGATMNALGDVYGSFTLGTEGAVRVLGRLGLSRGTGMDVLFDSSQDRLLEVPGNPFGIPVEKPMSAHAVELLDGPGLLVIADRMTPSLWLFGAEGGPASEFLREIDDSFTSGTAEPTALDYDATTDTLYVAVSNGTIYVYETFTTFAADTPDRTITPSDALGASQVSTRLGGLVHDAERDLLIVSDLGSAAAMGDDGAVMVFDGAASASGLTPALLTISGAGPSMDEPVNLAWDGSSLWVAEGENGTVLRFDQLLTLDGDVAPSASLAVQDVTAVTLIPTNLAPLSGGSILPE